MLTNAATDNCRPTNYRMTTSCHAEQQLYNRTQSFGTQALSTTKHNTMISMGVKLLYNTSARFTTMP